MSQEQTGQERTETATPKRRDDARKKGQVAKSRDLPGAIGLLAAAMVFWIGGGTMVEKMGGLMREHFTRVVRHEMTLPEFHQLIMSSAEAGIAILAPLMLVMVTVGVVANMAQTGPLISTTPLAPKWSKISPAKGIKRIFSATTLMELVKSIIKLGMIGTVVYLVLKNETQRLPALAGTDIANLLPYLGAISLKVMLGAGGLLLCLGVIDLLFQRYQHEKQLRMTKDEVRREMKETEGDPMVRARIRSVQREAAKKRMMADVPTADVVVTNPTHLAIAIKYETGGMSAPKVVAKGAGHIAAKIREIARANKVPVLEDKPLARALFKGVEVGREIPMELYQAVAEVLAFVYRLNQTKVALR